MARRVIRVLRLTQTVAGINRTLECARRLRLKPESMAEISRFGYARLKALEAEHAEKARRAARARFERLEARALRCKADEAEKKAEKKAERAKLEAGRAARDAEIRALRLSGMTLETIGARFSMTSERVRQLCRGLEGEVRRAKAARVEARPDVVRAVAFAKSPEEVEGILLDARSLDLSDERRATLAHVAARRLEELRAE